MIEDRKQVENEKLRDQECWFLLTILVFVFFFSSSVLNLLLLLLVCLFIRSSSSFFSFFSTCQIISLFTFVCTLPSFPTRNQNTFHSFFP